MCFNLSSWAQKSIPNVLKKYNKESVPYIKINAIKNSNSILLDAREPEEFKVSHIPNAIPVGFKNFKPENIRKLIKNLNTPIIVYCSIGVRSEQIGEKLQKMGYTQVYNLYGGIFEYKNKGGKVVNLKKQETDSIHAFNKQWSVYLNKGIKIYE
ncbi:rhodanese-like domain-containing protein [Flavobacterium faecale]|uniref:rhodanese-like domain-containing protein n=1 Tax=Flavobacterium faecale TaxID=1355330 RepID=UPI003AAAECFD